MLVTGGGIFGMIKALNINNDGENMKNNFKIDENLPVYRPLVAGSFYPGNSNALREMVVGFLKGSREDNGDSLISSNEAQIGSNETARMNGEVPSILMMPHAGLVFSGQVAGEGYKLVWGRDYETVAVVGVAHRADISGSAIYKAGYYETPLGKIEIDKEMTEKIVENGEGRVSYLEQEVGAENSIEVQLPFIQTVLPQAKAVLILMGQGGEENIESLARALGKSINKKTLVVISSDLSHYPEYSAANEVDKKTIEAVLSLDVGKLDEAIKESMNFGYNNLDTCACGEAGIKTGMLLAREMGWRGELVRYMNSGDVSGDKSQVVGYASIVFSNSKFEDRETLNSNYLNPKQIQNSNDGNLKLDDELREEDKKELLKIARETLKIYLKDGDIPEIKVGSKRLRKKLGAFVTLRRRPSTGSTGSLQALGPAGELRGCIGRFSPTDIPLYQVVQEMAMAAATEDIRFEPVTFDELSDIEIEISVLSEMKKIDDWREIEIGKHGVEIVQGTRRGVFLHQVATENNWNFETFMNELCEHKAGIERDAWKTGEAEIYIFTANVFSENGIIEG